MRCFALKSCNYQKGMSCFLFLFRVSVWHRPCSPQAPLKPFSLMLVSLRLSLPLLHFLLSKWFSPLQAKEGHVPEKSCTNNQTLQFLTTPKVLNILSTHWKLKPFCISPSSTYERHREPRSMPQCTHGEGGGMELPSALLLPGDDSAELPQTQIAFPVPKGSMASSEQRLCRSRENIPSEWGVWSASGSAVHILRVSHSTFQCFSEPQHPESHIRDVATTDLVQAENLSKI